MQSITLKIGLLRTYNMKTINTWFGRFGNNLQQISNAIYYCMENKINFYCPDHQYINSFEIPFGEDKDIASAFFFFNEEPLATCDIKKMTWLRSKILQTYVVPNFKFPTHINVNKDALVIHIRQGDIFNSPNCDYVQNPLWYFNKIMKDYKDVIVVTEAGTSNPVLDELAKDTRIKIRRNDVMTDFGLLMSATNLVSSGVGTFAVAAALCSSNIQNFYCTDLYLTEHLNPEMLKETSVFRTELRNYIKIGNWKNNLEQRELMLSYKGEEL
jgi:hypothetical protein